MTTHGLFRFLVTSDNRNNHHTVVNNLTSHIEHITHSNNWKLLNVEHCTTDDNHPLTLYTLESHNNHELLVEEVFSLIKNTTLTIYPTLSHITTNGKTRWYHIQEQGHYYQ